jgi:hypothetical protein
MVQANDKLVPPPKVGFSVLFFIWGKLSNRLDQAVVTLKLSSVWRRASRAFTCTLVGFNLGSLLRS